MHCTSMEVLELHALCIQGILHWVGALWMPREGGVLLSKSLSKSYWWGWDKAHRRVHNMHNVLGTWDHGIMRSLHHEIDHSTSSGDCGLWEGVEYRQYGTVPQCCMHISTPHNNVSSQISWAECTRLRVYITESHATSHCLVPNWHMALGRGRGRGWVMKYGLKYALIKGGGSMNPQDQDVPIFIQLNSSITCAFWVYTRSDSMTIHTTV